MDPATRAFLDHEARALLTRLARIKPFALHESMVPAANISPMAQRAIDQYLRQGRRDLRQKVDAFRAWLRDATGERAPDEQGQKRFTLLRLRFNAVLTQFDLFADALTQRSESDNGVWLSGLDAAAADALALPGYYNVPPVVCYLDRGAGAAIRRARTRLPGGGENPVAIVRVPRERMVGSGIASSLVHEVGHQAAALLDLVKSLQPVLAQRWRGDVHPEHSVWRYWERWISEIVADFWSVARVGVASTLGLIGVVSLPRPFAFRVTLDDPHPFPWIRVKLSCAMGAALYPHAQWHDLSTLWERLYPLSAAPAEAAAIASRLVNAIPDFLAVLMNHRPPALLGRSLRDAMDTAPRQPQRLSEHYRQWRVNPALMPQARPSFAFAVLGQARAEGTLSPEEESTIVEKLLVTWALHRTPAYAASGSMPRERRAVALVT